MEGRTPKIAVLISGSGSNLQAIIDAITTAQFEAEICTVISNKSDVFGLERARNAEIPAHVIEHHRFPDRALFDAQLMKQIDHYQPDLIILAGFMRILTDPFVRHYEGRMLNIHPSLLPKYPGLYTHKRALESGDKEHGVSIHFVTAELDSGPNIIQAKVTIYEGDTPETLAQRVLAQEHIIYPIAIKWFVEGRLQMHEHKAFLDNQRLPETGLVLEAAATLH